MTNACPKQARIDREAASLRDILRNHPEVRAEIERAYRRGYHHGAFHAAEAAREKFTADDLTYWESCVRRWRYDQKADDATCPPEPWEVR